MFTKDTGTNVPKWHWHNSTWVTRVQLFPSKTTTIVLKWDWSHCSHVTLEQLIPKETGTLFIRENDTIAPKWHWHNFSQVRRSGSTRAEAFDISKAFDRVGHAGLLHKRKSYGISGQILDLISSFLINRQLWVVLDGKSSQEYPVNAVVPWTWRLYLSYYTLITFLMMLYVIVLSMLMILLSILSVIRHLICGNN